MKKTSNRGDSSKLDRKTIEKNRRIHMKALCLKLSSIIPPNYIKLTKDMPSQLDQLDLATTYIKHLRERINTLKGKKEEAMNTMTRTNVNQTNERTSFNNNIGSSSELPLLEMRDLGSGIEVMLVSGLNNKNFMLCQVLGVIEEEGAEVVAANYSVLGDKVFYTVHAQVKISRVGVDTTRVYQRLHELIAPLGPENWGLLEEPYYYYELPSICT